MRGADPNVRSAEGLSPHDLAYQNDSMEIANLLANSMGTTSPYGYGYESTQSDGRTYVNQIIQDPNKVAEEIVDAINFENLYFPGRQRKIVCSHCMGIANFESITV